MKRGERETVGGRREWREEGEGGGRKGRVEGGRGGWREKGYGGGREVKVEGGRGGWREEWEEEGMV